MEILNKKSVSLFTKNKSNHNSHFESETKNILKITWDEKRISNQHEYIVPWQQHAHHCNK